MTEGTTRRATTTLVAALLLSMLGIGTATAGPAVDEERRMQLHCDNVELTIMRANGASWWGVQGDETDGSVYVTRELTVHDDEGKVVYQKAYGNKNPNQAVITCEAEHFGYHWVVTMVRTA
jgi:hypothetical protein